MFFLVILRFKREKPPIDVDSAGLNVRIEGCLDPGYLVEAFPSGFLIPPVFCAVEQRLRLI
jgi:hypothetical protein